MAGIPVKPFGVAKRRLAAVLSPAARVALSQGLAQRTCLALAEAGAEPLVLAADAEVAAWADRLGVAATLEDGSDLDLAAAAALRAVDGERRWLICHADLPFVEGAALRAVVRTLTGGRAVIAPSRDGGTTLIGGIVPSFRFSYGPGSFRRHLCRLAPLDPQVFVDPRLAVDLDEPSDLEAARRMPWIAALLDTLGGA